MRACVRACAWTRRSSIVCAFALGLAGGTNVLGRATRIGEFIRHGADEATIEIELHDGGDGSENVVVQRRITTDNKSTWRLNDRKVTESEVQKKMKELNVMVDNLCQFLPQDKVASFSSLDTIALLKETERAVDRQGVNLLSMH